MGLNPLNGEGLVGREIVCFVRSLGLIGYVPY